MLVDLDAWSWIARRSGDSFFYWIAAASQRFTRVARGAGPNSLLTLHCHNAVIRCSQQIRVDRQREYEMKIIRHLAVAVALGCGLVSCAEAHVFVGVGISAPALPVVPLTPVVAVYAPPPVYYAPPPPPVYTAPVVVGYYGQPRWYPRYHGGWHYGYGYWRR
jgi:hypothetical protein